MPDVKPDTDFIQAIVDNMADGVYYVDRTRRITYWNRGAQAISGYSAERVIGHHCYDDILNHINGEGVSLCKTMCPLAATMRDGQPREGTIWLSHAEGFRRPVFVRTAAIPDANGNIVGGVEVFSDSTALLKAEEEAERARRDALTDDLTRLPNRRHFEFALEGRLENLGRYGWTFGLLVADIDRFKKFNDGHGHPFGDAILANVARSLEGGVRGGDMVARWGGEEFAILVEASTRTGLADIAERLRLLVANSTVKRRRLARRVEISIGAALARPGDTTDSLFARADAALFRAKGAGRNRIELEPETASTATAPTATASTDGEGIA